MLTPLARTAALLAAGLLAAAAAAEEPVRTGPCSAATRCATPDRGKLVTKAYSVAELVVPVGEPGKQGEARKTCENDLIRTIQQTLARATWASNGGDGTIDYFPLSGTLIVNQTPDVQEQVADLLSRLRREQDTEVALEVRLVSVAGDSFERVGVDFNAPPDGCGECPAKKCVTTATPLPGATEKGAVLSGKQVAQFLEAVQGDQRANVMQAPKVTVFNGQMANVHCTDSQKFVTGVEVVQRDGRPVLVPKTEDVATGFRMAACPVVSADRRSVQVSLDIDLTDLASPAVPLCPVTVESQDEHGKPQRFTQFLQQPKVNTLRIRNMAMIPDGGTVLFGGVKQVAEGRVEYGPPVLTKVPYMSRLFKNVGYGRETKTLYVLVTPRVIVNEEPEQRQTACTRCTVKPCGTEESEAAPAPRAESKVMAELLKAYDAACAAGHKDEAAKLAQAALVLDPTCFARSRGK